MFIILNIQHNSIIIMSSDDDNIEIEGSITDFLQDDTKFISKIPTMDLIPLTDHETFKQSEDQLAVLTDCLERLRKTEHDGDMIEKLQNMIDDAHQRSKLDKDLINLLQSLSEVDGSKLYQKKEYSEIMSKIDKSSVIIYFKKANVFKVYTPQTLESYFIGQSNTALKNKGDIYEVVNKNTPQKIIILIDGSISSDLHKIRDYIFKFLTLKVCPDLNESDLTIFNNHQTKHLEILINGIYVNSYEEKEVIIKQLIDYIETEEMNKENPLDIGKIEPRRVKEFTDAEVFLIPERKVCVENNKYESLKKYVSNINNCRALTIQGSTINIINVQGGTNTILVNGDQHNESLNEESDTIDDIQNFIDYIKHDKPSWYKGGSWVFINTLYEKFGDFCDSNMNINKFSRGVHTKLFKKKATKYINKKQGRAVLLFAFDNIN